MNIFQNFMIMCDNIIDSFTNKAREFIDYSAEEKVYLFSFFLRVIDLARSFILLQMHGGSKCAPIIIRATLEAYFTLINLAHDRKHVEFLKFKSLNTSKKLLDLKKNLKNDVGLQDIDDFINSLDEEEKPLNIINKFHYNIIREIIQL